METDGPSRYRIFDARPPVRIRGTFPQEAPGPAVGYIIALSVGKTTQLLSARNAGMLRQLIALGIVEQDGPDSVHLIRTDLVKDGYIVPVVLREILERQPGLSTALAMLEVNPAEKPDSIGEALRSAYGAEWSPATIHWIGKNVRAWARYAGVATSLRRRAGSTGGDQAELDLS